MLTLVERGGVGFLGERRLYLYPARSAQQRNKVYHSDSLKERQNGYQGK
jgi:hypothetical protein